MNEISTILLFFVFNLASAFLDWSERRFLDGASWSGHDFGNLASPRLVPGAWGTCSATCGPGVSSRSVECVAIHPITSNIIQLPDSECAALQQPPLFQPCEMRPCPLQEDAKDTPDTSAYRWEHGDWGLCSASCLGGKQKAALVCMEAATKRAVAWAHCDPRRRPPERSRACNTQPCPASWQVSQFSECTASCGGGTNTRSVRCVRPISKSGGADANLILPDSQCPHPKPPETQPCAQVTCPADWITGGWSECSSSCGPGEQRRRVECEGRDSRGRSVRRAPIECAAQKPHDIQMCNLGPCDKPQLKSNRVFEQSADEKKLTIGIGGVAKLYQGTSIKIKCPRKNFDKKKIYWTKDGRRVKNDAHIKVSANGNLRISHARMEDAGTYECFTDTLQGNVTLAFKYRDEEQESIQSGLASNRVDAPVHLKHSRLYNISSLHNLLSEVTDGTVLLEELKKHAGLYKVNFDLGSWSECHQKTCGVHGFQARDISCLITVEGGFRKRVEAIVCSGGGTPKPPTTRPCQMSHCPQWETSEWTECSQSRCIRDGIAQQRRGLRCLATNGTEVDMSLCDRASRPKPKKECDNPRCKAEWKASEWGACTQDCGSGGMQLRMLQCVWTSSGRPAGRSCEGVRRPPAARPCPQAGLLPPCQTPTALPLQDASCEDLSRFCDIIKLFHSCDSEEVRQRCCSSCARVEARRRH